MKQKEILEQQELEEQRKAEKVHNTRYAKNDMSNATTDKQRQLVAESAECDAELQERRQLRHQAQGRAKRCTVNVMWFEAAAVNCCRKLGRNLRSTLSLEGRRGP